MSMRGGHGPGPVRGLLKKKERTRPVKTLLGWLLGYLRPFILALILISLIIFAFTILSILTPILIQQSIDLVVITPTFDAISIIIILFVCLSITTWIFESLSKWALAGLRARIVQNIRNDTFSHLVDADMTYHHSHQSGNITSRVINDTEEVSNGIAVFTTGSTQLLIIVATFLVLIMIDWVFAAIALLSVPVAVIITKIIGSIGRRRMLKARNAIGNVSAKLAENLSGIVIAKSFNREKTTSEEIRKLNFQSYDYMRRIGMIFTIVMPSIAMISTILVALTLLAGGFINSTSGMTIGTIYLATIMVQRFLMPIINLSNYFTQLQASLAAMDRVVDVLETKPTIEDSSTATDLDPKNADIKFEKVSFEYVPKTPVLRDITFTIKGGEKIALVGHTGAGKTTITALLMRFYDPISGRILIGNQDLKSVKLISLHEQISLVSQEPYVFADTVLENLRYGKPSATDEEIFELCRLLGADDFIEALPDGYNTFLQESGKSLSAGQRQMITIARTMLSDPKFLVLDEATSRLDAYSESLVQLAQGRLFEGRTTLVIAHRLSTIRDVDRIIVLDKGAIVEEGSHEELMQTRGHYYDLYRTYYAHQSAKALDESLIEGIEVPSLPLRHPPSDMMKKQMMKKQMMLKGKKGRGGRPFSK